MGLKCILNDCCQNVYLNIFLCLFFDTYLESYPLSLWKNTSFSIWKEADKAQWTVLRQSIVERVSPSTSFFLTLHPLPPFFITFFCICKLNTTDATEWKMKRYHGLQSTSSALPKSFHLLPQQVVKQKTRSKTKTKKHQRPSGPYSAILLNFFFLFFLLTKWS